MQRTVSFITSSLFVLCLFGPLILGIVSRDKEISEIEKRRLAPLPALEFSRQSLRELPRKFEEYYDDHLGGRDQLIAIYDYINFTFFGISPVANVILGRDNWLFLRGEGVLPDYLGVAQEDLQDLEGFKRVLVDRRNWLAERNIQYLFVPVPNKIMIYDDYLPSRMRKEAGRTFYDQFLQYLDDTSDFDEYLDVKAILLQAKEEQVVFLKTDTHWNSDGSFVVYQHIVNRLRKWFPQMKMLQVSDLEKSERQHSGDLARMMHMKKPLSETAPSNRIKDRCASEKTEIFRGFTHEDKRLANRDRYLPVMNGCPGEQFTALVIHDSFGYFLRPWLSESFSRIIYMHYSDFDGLKDLIEKERPDVVIDQRVARNLASAMRRDHELEAYFSRKHFNEQQQVLLDLTGDQRELRDVECHELELRRNQEGLVLNATGGDPYLLMPFTAEVDNEPLLVKITLTSPHETVLQLMYTTVASPQFVPAQMVSQTIHKGTNELLFRLPDPDISGTLRLDPGGKAGEYLLQELIIKRENTRLAGK